MTSSFSGQNPATPDDLFALFEALNISVIRHQHPFFQTFGSRRGLRLKVLFLGVDFPSLGPGFSLVKLGEISLLPDAARRRSTDFGEVFRTLF